MNIPSKKQKHSRLNRLKTRVFSIFLIAAIVLAFGMSDFVMPAFAITGDNEGEETVAIAEVTDTVDETADTVDETTDTVEEATDTVDKTADTVEETADTVDETTDTIEETTDTVVTSTDTVEETTDTVVTPTDTIDETTDSTEEIPEEFPLAAVSETDVCSVGDKGYESIEAAVADNTSGTITMLKNVDYNVNCAVTIPSGKSFTLDLSGKTISSSAPEAAISWVIRNKGTLKIKDSAGGGKIVLNAAQPDMQTTPGYPTDTIANYGTITISSGTIENATSRGGACYAVDFYDGSSATINGGTFNASSSDAVRLYVNSATEPCNVVINNGTFNSPARDVLVQCPTAGTTKGSLVINGGTFITTHSRPDYRRSVYASGSSNTSSLNTTIAIHGGTFGGDVVTDRYLPTTNITVTGGVFNGRFGFYTYNEDAGVVSGGHFTGEEAYDMVFPYFADGYTDIYEIDGVPYAVPELEEDEIVGRTFDVYKFTEVTVTPDAKTRYTDETSDPELTYTLDKPEFAGFITVELERAAGTSVGSYAITAKTLKGSLDTTTNPDDPMYYLPLFSENEVKLTIKDAGYIKHTESNDTPEGSVEAESYARSDVELVVEHTAPAAEQKIEDALTDKEEMLFTQEVHFERDGDHVTVGEVCRDGKVNVTFNVGEKYNGLSVVVYHVVSATRTDRDVKTVENGKVSYTAYSLSPFGIALLQNNLTITNAVKGKEASKDDEFTYKLELAFPDTFSYDIMDKSGTVLSSGTISDGGEFTLKGNQRIVVKDLPVGVEYEITETAPDGYTISFKNNKGKVAASGSTAAFTNTKGSSSGGSPKTGDESASLAVQICTVLMNLSLLGLIYAIFFDKSKALTKLFSKKAEGSQNDGQ